MSTKKAMGANAADIPVQGQRNGNAAGVACSSVHVTERHPGDGILETGPQCRRVQLDPRPDLALRRGPGAMRASRQGVAAEAACPHIAERYRRKECVGERAD